MSLLDLLQSQDPAVNNGLLNFGLSLLRSKGNFGNAVGQAGVAGQLGARDFRQQEALMKRAGLNDQLLQMQLAEAKRQEQIKALPQQFARTPAQMAMGANGGPTVAAANAVPSTAPGFDMQGYLGALQGLDPVQALTLQQAIRKQAPTLTPVKKGETLGYQDPNTGKWVQVAQGAPDEESLDPLTKLFRARDALPPGHPNRAIYDQAILKSATHAPATSVSYGAPIPAVDASGKPVFIQPSKDGGPPSVVPGYQPPPQNRDTKLPAELQRMQIAGDAMVKLMDDYEALLKKHNPRDPMTQANPTVRADMQALKRNIELQFKELQALGALAGPDIEIMRQSLSDPFTFAGAYYGKDGLLSQVKRARELVKTRSDAVLKSQGKPGDAAAPAADNDPLGLRK